LAKASQADGGVGGGSAPQAHRNRYLPTAQDLAAWQLRMTEAPVVIASRRAWQSRNGCTADEGLAAP